MRRQALGAEAMTFSRGDIAEWFGVSANRSRERLERWRLTPAGCTDPIAALHARLGDAEAERRLVERFCHLGARGRDHAEAAWRALGLDPAAARELGLALQTALAAADREAEETGLEEAEAIARIEEGGCSLEIQGRASPSAPDAGDEAAPAARRVR